VKKPVAAAAAEDEGKEHKIYVKGLPWLATEKEVSDFFKDCGKTVSVDLPMGVDGRSTGTAFVVFAARAGVDAAMELDGQIWPGTERWLKIQEGFEKPEKRFSTSGGVRPEGCNTVFVGNLPWDVEESHMHDIFGPCGEISRVRFSMTEEGEFRGFGHVEFADGACTDAAVLLAGTDINGRAIRVDYAPPRDRNSLGAGGRGGRDGGRGGRDGGRGGRGGRDGGRGGRGGGTINKNKGSIASGAPGGKKISFDD
jgi:nucleolin